MTRLLWNESVDCKAKHVEWLTVQLANNSEEITSIKHELDQLTQKENEQETSNSAKITTLKNS